MGVAALEDEVESSSSLGSAAADDLVIDGAERGLARGYGLGLELGLLVAHGASSVLGGTGWTAAMGGSWWPAMVIGGGPT
jgi:hypothetical protein